MLKIVLWILLILTVFGVVGMVTDKKEKHSIKEVLIASVVGLVLIFFIFHKSQPSDTSAKDNSVREAKISSKKSSSENNAEASSRAAESSSKATEASSRAATMSSSEAVDKDPSSYKTGITYDQVARMPDDYEGKKMQFTGRVIQVIEGKSETQIRLAVDGNSDNIVLVGFDPDILNGSRVLEDDLVTVSGTSVGTVSYKSTMGGKITIPAMVAKIINDQGKASDDYGY